MRYGRPQDDQHGGTNPRSRGIWNIWSITCYRYGHRNIRYDKYRKALPIVNALLERVS